ncbi:hypothetical protein BS47DRAFT_1422829 [Hydnum rufescens UP504]|uniref:LCCL domain-containing protein n=1 Tax=Hydnum rufescens UP504 TaxID=1448309 RepID=A0A9P6B6N1_9AGAM|nr:hypothetical protein BS47DRAFT_1422829 [Hydnum rufescens UP504]
MESLFSRSPRLSRWLQWLRGPGKEAALPHPIPWLQITLTFQNRTQSFPLEHLIIRATRRFTSPVLLAILTIVYIISLAFFARAQWYQTPSDDFLDCTSTFWLKDNGCGLNGQLCTPFNTTSPLEFRCPATCSSVILANQRAVGAQEVKFVPLVVGGGDPEHTYRGDSWICVAALQAGVTSPSTGGCGALERIGTYTNFLSADRNAVHSTSFPSEFPLAFRFVPTPTVSAHCTDMRREALVFNILVSVILFVVLRPPSLVLYWCLLCIGFWHNTFFSDPRAVPAPISDAFGVFLPLLFVAYAMWRCAFRFVLPAFEALPIERAVWYLGAYWPGVLINVVFEHVPIDRLIVSDIAERRGALTSLLIIVVLVIILILNQMHVIRNSGLLLRYLSYYFIGGLVILVLAMLPGLTFRLHHYVFAILLIPGTGFPTRISAIIQAFLLGMLVDGISRWGFDSILQTSAQLRRDAPLGSSLPTFSKQHVLVNSTSPPSYITWDPISPILRSTEGWNGFSLIVDDVERYVGTALNYTLASLDWNVVHFFRLAFQKDGKSGDYTKAAMIFPNGSFVPPLPGPS